MRSRAIIAMGLVGILVASSAWAQDVSTQPDLRREAVVEPADEETARRMAQPDVADVFVFLREKAPSALPRLAKMKQEDLVAYRAEVALLMKWMVLYGRAERVSPESAELILTLLQLDDKRDDAAARFFRDPNPSTLAEVRGAFESVAEAETKLHAALLAVGATDIRNAYEQLDWYRENDARRIEAAVSALLGPWAGPETERRVRPLPEPKDYDEFDIYDYFRYGGRRYRDIIRIGDSLIFEREGPAPRRRTRRTSPPDRLGPEDYFYPGDPGTVRKKTRDDLVK